MNTKMYLGDLLGASLLVTETRVVAESLLTNLPHNEWKTLIIDQNILQKKSQQTAIRYARTIRTRIEKFGNSFISALLITDNHTYIQMLMMALIIDSPIVADFMQLILAETRRIYKPALPVDSWAEFYNDKIKAYADLGKLSNASIAKMGNNAIKALVDTGYLSDSRTKKIQPVYLTPEVKDWLIRLNREDLIDVMECTI